MFHEEKSRKYSSVVRVALRKLIEMNRAKTLEDLRVPPGNRLEPLKGNLEGLYSIRINDQWRIIFKWSPEGPQQV
ncbi:type II toxin-antitoxin system RelE/ParE family toxin [Kiritimatiellaeota bacterium B1221]|nr:type II toxin-antitoxin system RelE/ParE family toxin [Kiritimatiellaeota bacterium B1221]